MRNPPTFRGLAVVFITLLYFPLSSQNNVGVGTITPSYPLHVEGPMAATSAVLHSQSNYIGDFDVSALRGHAVNNPGWGYGGYFTGGFKGVHSIADAGNYVASAFAVYGTANGTAGTRYGLYGTATGTTLTNYGVFGIANNASGSNYGVYGQASGGMGYYGIYGHNTNLAGYAGYFNGRGHFTQELRADKNLVVDDTTWTSKVWNMGGILGMRSTGDIELMIDRNDDDGLAAAYEIFRGDGGHVFLVSESGISRSFGNHLVDNNLGIGSLAPVTRLHIPTGNDVSEAGLGFAQFGLTNGNNLVMDNNEILARTNGVGSDLYLQNDAGDLILCGLEAGSVGIGVQSGASIPVGYLLAVNGKIISEELRIENSTSWPDYVFADQYPLIPLDELRKVITTQKHLPNIPPAAVVEKEGILVGDMQVRMMEKIEELTLYILELHETNKQQQSEIEQLRNLVTSLQKE